MSSGKYTEICHYISLDFYDQRILYPFSSCAGALSFSFRKEIPPEEFLEFLDSVVRAVLPVEDAAGKLPAPAVIKDHAVHCVVDFILHQRSQRFPKHP